MTKPHELCQDLEVEVAGKQRSTTTKLWNALVASSQGDLSELKKMIADCPGLAYGQFNYTPPIHFAVRENHPELVRYLLSIGAHDPAYRIYPFQESLQTLAEDRGLEEIVSLHDAYALDSSRQQYSGDNGKIFFNWTPEEKALEKAADKNLLDQAIQLLKDDPKLVDNPNYFWGEGLLTRPAKDAYFDMMKLLLDRGAAFPARSKWPQFYFFERYDASEFILQNGMSPDHKTWQEVTILHDMAQKGNLPMVQLLISHGAEIDPVDDEYQSTPLGMAVRWGHIETVQYLLKKGADPEKSGASWASPLAWAKRKKHQAIESLVVAAINK